MTSKCSNKHEYDYVNMDTIAFPTTNRELEASMKENGRHVIGDSVRTVPLRPAPTLDNPDKSRL